jgi:integrase
MSVKLREKKLSKGGISFYLDVYKNGKRSYDTLDIKIYPGDSTQQKKEKKEIANLARSNKEIDLISNGYNYLPSHNKKIKFSDYAEAYLDNYTKKDKAMIDATIKQFKTFSNNSNLKLNAIDKKVLLDYKDYLEEKAGLSGETPYNYFARLKKIFNDAYEHNIIPKNPATGIKFSKRSKDDTMKKQVFSTSELELLYKSECNYPELKKAFLFACGTGLGLAEILKLRWTNVKNGILDSNRAKTGTRLNFKLQEQLVKMIGQPQEGNKLIFHLVNKKGNQLTSNGANFRLGSWMKKLKMEKDITFYCGRHTFATQLLLHGANLKTVSELMGHSDIRSTMKYLNYIDELKDNAIDSLPTYEL